MPLERPHTATVKLTREQYQLAKERFQRTGMSWQKLFAAAVNAYVRGDLEIHRDGSYSVGQPDLISYEDDAEAIDLDDIPDDEAEPTVLTTRDLQAKAERETGRRVPLPLLRRLIRERFPQVDEPTPGTRYRWPVGHPDVEAMISAINEGVLDELRANVNRSFNRGSRAL